MDNWWGVVDFFFFLSFSLCSIVAITVAKSRHVAKKLGDAVLLSLYLVPWLQRNLDVLGRCGAGIRLEALWAQAQLEFRATNKIE